MRGRKPRIGITLGDPRGIGREVVAGALARRELGEAARWVLVGPELPAPLPDPDAPPWRPPAGMEYHGVARWEPGRDGSERAAGRVAGRAVEHALSLALEGGLDGLVTAPLSKGALAAAGYRWPGHTEWLRDVSGVPEVTMMMAAETTPLGGPLRMALLTGHVPLREVPARLTVQGTVTRTRIAARALRDWWGIPRPRLAFAGINPHASEGGLFGDEEARILEPALRELEEESEEVAIEGIHPADTVFRRCLDGRVDAVVVPFHDVGLAVIKTLAMETGVNVTAGLPFPRTSPDHGTAMELAGTGRADPSSMAAALELCLRFCARNRTAATATGDPGSVGDG